MFFPVHVQAGHRPMARYALGARLCSFGSTINISMSSDEWSRLREEVTGHSGCCLPPLEHHGIILTEIMYRTSIRPFSACAIIARVFWPLSTTLPPVLLHYTSVTPHFVLSPAILLSPLLLVSPSLLSLAPSGSSVPQGS